MLIQYVFTAGRKLIRNSGPWLWLQQFRAMFTKRLLHSWRRPFVTVMQILVPTFFTLLCCILKHTIGESLEDQPPLALKYSNFDAPVSPFTGNCDAPVSPFTGNCDAPVSPSAGTCTCR